jgi:hypothetical protein
MKERGRLIYSDRIHLLRVGAMYRYQAKVVDFYWQSLTSIDYDIIPDGAFLLYLGTDLPGSSYRDPCFLYDSKIYNLFLSKRIAGLLEVE